MNDHELLEQELKSLGDELRTPPSIAEAVLRRIARDAHEGTRPEESLVGLTGQTIDHESPQSANPNRTRLRPRRFTSMTAAVAVVAASVLAVLFLRIDSIAFAQVRERLAAVRTATFSMTQSVVKRLPGGETSPVEIQRRLLVRTDGRIRVEGPEGLATVTSPDDFVSLELDPSKRMATRRYLYEVENRQDIVAALRSLPQSVKAVKIATTEIGGIECPGFRIEEPQSTLLVWVDPKTGLPVRAELSYAKAINEADRDVVSVTERYDDMRFDEPLADELFSVTPPDGYVVTTVGTPPANRQELFSMPLVLTPNVGVGPLKFGTSRAEILQLLGKPDSEDVRIPIVPITDKTSNVDGKERPPGASLVVLTKLHNMNYWGIGLSLTLEAEEGLRGIQCWGQDTVGAAGRTFRGATDKGIRIGSSAEEVLTAYGEPDENPSDSKQKNGNLKYRELHLEFGMTEKQTVRFINLSAPYEYRLRFEWRVPQE